jgi:uncharacterized lipoprotein YddW (UPF0748 family)
MSPVTKTIMRAIFKACFRFLGLLFYIAIGAAAAAGGVEVRAVWMPLEGHVSEDPAKGVVELQAMIDKLANANFNTVLLFIRSDYLVALDDEAYRKPSPLAAWDAVGKAIDLCDQHGLKVEAWYSFTHYKSPASPEFDPKQGGDPAWASVALGELGSSTRSMLDCCPMHANARAWQLKLIKRLLKRYPKLSGVHLEEPGYGYADRCACDRCQQTFQAVYEAPLKRSFGGERNIDLRCLATTAFVRDLHSFLRKEKPNLKLAVNGGPDWRVDRSLGRDWRRWADFAWLDYYAAQVYTPDVVAFTQQSQSVLTSMQGRCPVYIGMAAKWSGGETTPAILAQEVAKARELGADGVALYHASALMEGYLDALKAGPFKEPAKWPE